MKSRLLALLIATTASAADYKTGIDADYSGTAGVDYQIEHSFHDRTLFDRKVVYIKATTDITLSHNDRNVSYAGSGRYSAVVEPNVGAILYKIDRDLQWGPSWGDGGGSKTFSMFGGGTQSITQFNNTTYSAPFALEDLTYDGSTPVVGTTGSTGTITNWGTYYWRGILDDVGDEWHVLTVADYDSFVSDAEGKASDGNVILLVVNPKTPCLTISVTGDAQFYTTPAKIYFQPKIHNQTTYFSAGTGTVSFSLVDINGNDVVYRINGGSWSSPAANPVLDQDDFSAGSNTLEYYYEGNEAYVKTRTVVKDPAYPSAGETHGHLLWGDSDGLDAIKARVDRAPYSSTYTLFDQNDNTKNPLTNFDAAYQTGKRSVFGKFAVSNALVAAIEGITFVPAGKSKSSALYAKQMIMDSERTLQIVGMEIDHSGRALPTRELFYRGYYDVDCTFSIAFAYDFLIANFKSTQQTGGITAVEDYYIRDLLAGCAYDAMLQEGNYVGQQYPNTGMWGTARNIGGLIVAMAMPSYSTPYYGTSGFDGNTTVYPWTPFPDTPLTWKKVFAENDATLVGYPNLNYRFGVEEYQWPASSPGDFDDRIAYLAPSLMGHVFAILSNTTKMHTDLEYPRMDAGRVKMGNNTVIGLKNPSEVYTAYTDGVDNFFRKFALLLWNNDLHPDTAADGITYGKWVGLNYPGQTEAEGYEIYRTAPYSFVYYDDTFDAPPPSGVPDAPTALTATASGAGTILLTWSSPEGEVNGISIQRSLDGSTGWEQISSVPAATEAFTDRLRLLPSTAYYYRVLAYNADGNSDPSSTASATTGALSSGNTNTRSLLTR
jgi:hypothetical protein